MVKYKYSSEVSSALKGREKFIKCFPGNCLKTVFGNRLVWPTIYQTIRCPKKQIRLSGSILKERLGWLRNVFQMMVGILPKIMLFCDLSGAKRKTGRPEWEGKNSQGRI